MTGRLMALAVVLAAALGGFAIYTRGWHDRSNGHVSAEVSKLESAARLQQANIAHLQAQVRRDDQMILDACDSLRSTRKFRQYRGTAAPTGASSVVVANYVIALLHFFASNCDETHGSADA